MNPYYEFNTLEESMDELLHIMQSHDDSFSEDKLYLAHMDYNKTATNFSFGERAHIFTGYIQELIKNKCFMKKYPYNVVKIEALEDAFLVTAKTKDDSIVSKVTITKKHKEHYKS